MKKCIQCGQHPKLHKTIVVLPHNETWEQYLYRCSCKEIYGGTKRHAKENWNNANKGRIKWKFMSK